MNDFELSNNTDQTEIGGNRQPGKSLLNFSLTFIPSLEMNLNVVRDVNLEDPNSIFSEMACKPNQNADKELDCVYVSRRGNGTRKPTKIKIRNVASKPECGIFEVADVAKTLRK